MDPISNEQSTIILSMSLASFNLISILPPRSLSKFDAPSTTSTTWSPSPHWTLPPCSPHRTQPPPCPQVRTGLWRRVRRCSIPMVGRSRLETDTSSRTELGCSRIRHKIMYSSLLISEASWFFGVWRQGETPPSRCSVYENYEDCLTNVLIIHHVCWLPKFACFRSLPDSLIDSLVK